MSWYAQIKNNIVSGVIYVVDGKDADWCKREYGGTWLGCSEDGTIRGNFPAIGFIYDEIEDIFCNPKPYPSWILNKQDWKWYAPTPMPTDGEMYRWDEETTSWVVLQQD